jgi:hypothetical protein
VAGTGTPLLLVGCGGAGATVDVDALVGEVALTGAEFVVRGVGAVEVACEAEDVDVVVAQVRVLLLQPVIVMTSNGNTTDNATDRLLQKIM